MPPQTPVATPVTFSFDSGGIQLTSVIDLENKAMTCDLCSQVIKLGIRGSINHISQHRDGEKCKRKAFKMSKLDSKSRNLVSGTILIMLCSLFITKEEEKALGISEHNTVDWRRQNNIPDTELGLTRKRSDTVSR
jgi:hypothetical protein